MPRTNLLVAREQLAIAEAIRKEYGNMLTATDVGRFLGAKHAKTAKEFLQDVPGYCVGSRVKYFAADIAKKLYENKETEGIA